MNFRHLFLFFSTFERIAKKILLAQIKANYSSGDELSSDEETQEDESESDADKKVKQGNEDNSTDENGKSPFFFFKVALLSFFSNAHFKAHLFSTYSLMIS